ncbi:unnamed protein product [Rotaria socialis]|uniref:Hint domain-containing protein n=1 Tax=Rotaria socialis TaxID=392032 RepID=A0A820YP55_9BILA|nr:unnamed protein product [Rotaria socialis]
MVYAPRKNVFVSRPQLKSKHKKRTHVNLYSPSSKPSISNQTKFSSDAFDNNLKQNTTTIKQKLVLTRVIMLPMISIFVLLAIAILAYGITSVFIHQTDATSTGMIRLIVNFRNFTRCYFGEDYVNLVDGGQRAIKNLLVGDRIWTLSSDGRHLIDDEIILMLHAEPKTIIPFYTFITQEGHSISLSGSHNILVVANREEKTQIIRASKVTLNHRLIIASRTVGLKKIEYSQRTGFYSPLTRTSYLLVNNISTSVFVDSFHATHDTLHRVFAPIRMYYYITRWFYSDSYNPFETNIKEGLHPLAVFILKNDIPIRLFFIILPHLQRSMFIFIALYLSRQLFFYGKNHFYFYFY